MSGLQFPRVEDLRVRCEILYISGDHSEAVALRSGHKQAAHHRYWLPGQFGVGSDLRPDVERCGIKRQDASREPLLDLAQPGGEFLAAMRVAGS